MNAEVVWHGSLWREFYHPLPAPPLPMERAFSPRTKDKRAKILAAMADGEVYDWPTLQAKTGLARKTISNHLTQLCHERVIERIGLGIYQRRSCG